MNIARKTLQTLSVLLAFFAASAGCGEAHAIGLLIPTERSLPPLAIKSHRVTVDITDSAAVTKVEQVFVNNQNRPLEATFVFPVPAGATVSDFSLWINGRKTKGTVLERGKARGIYEGIVRRLRDPGLVEYMDGSLFQARIFPVPARGEQKVEISYASVMDQVGDMRRFLYPLKTGRSSAQLMEDFTIVVNVSSRAKLKAIYSPSHRIAVSRKSDHDATISVEETAADLERDFLLYMGTGDKDIGLSLMTYDRDGPGGEPGYFLMVLSPQIEARNGRESNKTLTFVVDTSGSMIGEKMEQARGALLTCLQQLRVGDRFNVIRFATDVESLFGRPMPASIDNVQRGIRFAKQMEAAGGTSIDEALTEALRTQGSARGSLPPYVIFMTDGRPTVGDTNISHIISHAKANNHSQTRLFTFGVGYDVNTTLLDRIASDNAGLADYIRPNEDIEVKVAALFNKIAYPALADLQVDYGPSGVYDVYPRQLPDLFRGGQVVAMGRTRRPLSSTLKLTGRIGAEHVQMEFHEDSGIGGGSVAHDFVPKLWATRKVGYLLSEIRTKGEVPELKDEVVRLARKYGLVTPYTSYLAVDDSEFDQPLRPPPIVHVPRRARVSGGGGGGGSYGSKGEATGASIRPAPAPSMRPTRSYAKKKARERVLRGRGGMSADSGRQAVETSLATEELKRAETEGESGSIGTRYVDGQLFVLKSGAWQQDGVHADRKALKIKYMSDAYFALLKARPDLRSRLSLGKNVTLKVGRKTVVIGSSGIEKLDAKTIARW